MNEAVKKITTDAQGNAVITVEWNGRTFMVQVGEGGVVVSPPDADGNVNTQELPGVWIDPFCINDEDRDPVDGEAPLLVHSYFDNEQEAPVTVELRKNGAIVRGDGLPFAEIQRNSNAQMNTTKYI